MPIAIESSKGKDYQVVLARLQEEREPEGVLSRLEKGKGIGEGAEVIR
jgi:hypothetical protein